MRMVNRASLAVSVGAAAALLTACQGNSASPASAPPVLSTAPYAHDQFGSWVAPGARAASSLLYVSNSGNKTVTIYSWDDGNSHELVGTLKGFKQPAGMCVDKSGNVYVVDSGAYNVYEYAHGQTQRLQSISERPYGIPYSCAVDIQKSGDLAVVNGFDKKRHLDPNVRVYANGSGGGTGYEGFDNSGDLLFSAYDNTGNLYVDGFDNYGIPGLFSLPRHGGSFGEVAIHGASISTPTALVWINPTLMIGDQDFQQKGISGAYKLNVYGTQADVVGKFPFKGTIDVNGFSRRGNRLIAPDQTTGDVTIFTFPQGKPYSVFNNNVSKPFASAVSQFAQ
jgi:NHL repeat-containing protein